MLIKFIINSLNKKKMKESKREKTWNYTFIIESCFSTKWSWKKNQRNYHQLTKRIFFLL